MLEVLDEDILSPSHELYQGTEIARVARKYLLLALMVYVLVGVFFWINGNVYGVTMMCFNPLFFLAIGKCLLMKDRWAIYLRMGEKHLYSYKKRESSKKLLYKQLVLIEQKDTIIIRHKLFILSFLDFNRELEIRLLKDSLNRPYINLIDDLRLKGVRIKPR